MQNDSALDTTLRQFVLGRLDDRQRLAIEERLVVEPETFEALEVIEDELTEAYVEDMLSRADRRGFEDHFLTNPNRCRQADFLRLLRARAADHARETDATPVRSFVGRWSFRPAWAGVLAASLCVAIGAAVWLGVRESSLRHEVAALRTERAQQAQDVARLQAQVAREATQSSASGFSALFPAAPTIPLAVSAFRDTGTLPRIDIPQRAATVRFAIALRDASFPSYRAVFYNVDSEELWSVSKLRATRGNGLGTLTVVVPSELLPRGDYKVIVSGVATNGRGEILATYPFRVLSEQR